MATTSSDEIPPAEHSDHFSVRFSLEFPLDFSEEDYVRTIHGTIVRERELTSRSTATPEPIGSVKLLRIDGGRALNEGENLWDACDAHSQEAADLYRVLFRRGYDFKRSIERMFPDAMSPDVLLIELIRLVPQARGRGLGLRAARRAMDAFESHYGLVVVQPFPLQFNAHERKHRDDPDLATFDCSEQTALAKLRRHWSQLGFERLGRSDYFALSPTVRTTTIRDLDVPREEEFSEQ